MSFNVGDTVRVLDTESTTYEAGYVGTVVMAGPLPNGEDYLVRITDRTGAVNADKVPNYHEVSAIMQFITGDDLTYPANALELV